MRQTAILCYSKDGLLSAETLTALYTDRTITDVALFTDGTPKALEWLKRLSDTRLLKDRPDLNLWIANTPKYELRVRDLQGNLSHPQYVYKEEDKIKWFCLVVANQYLKVHITDITSQSGTKAQLDDKTSATVCHISYRIWKLLELAEQELAFPAVVIDRMMRWTYNLTPQTIDIEQLRSDTNLRSLSYHPDRDMLEVEVAGQTYSTKLSILNQIYGDLILPHFNQIYGRRFHLEVAVVGSGGHETDPVAMSYGDLGRIVKDMMIYMVDRTIGAEEPIDPRDLLEFSKKVKIDAESCIHVPTHDALVQIVDQLLDDTVPGSIQNNIPNPIVS